MFFTMTWSRPAMGERQAIHGHSPRSPFHQHERQPLLEEKCSPPPRVASPGQPAYSSLLTCLILTLPSRTVSLILHNDRCRRSVSQERKDMIDDRCSLRGTPNRHAVAR